MHYDVVSITMIVVIVKICYGFLKFCTLENNLTINLTRKPLQNITTFQMMLPLSKIKQKVANPFEY